MTAATPLLERWETWTDRNGNFMTVTYNTANGAFAPARIDYTGKVDGDSMKLKMNAGAREPLDVTAKRK